MMEVQRHDGRLGAELRPSPPQPQRLYSDRAIVGLLAVIVLAAVGALSLVSVAVSVQLGPGLLAVIPAFALLLVLLLGPPGSSRRRRARWNARPGRHPFEADL